MLYAREGEGPEGGETFVCMYICTYSTSIYVRFVDTVYGEIHEEETGREGQRERGGASLEANLQRGALHVLMN
jgi:hypothetical protein